MNSHTPKPNRRSRGHFAQPAGPEAVKSEVRCVRIGAPRSNTKVRFKLDLRHFDPEPIRWVQPGHTICDVVSELYWYLELLK